MRKNTLGFSLVELMVAVLISMILTVGVITLYIGQVRAFTQTARKAQTTQEAQAAFDLITGLVRQAQLCLTCAIQQSLTSTYAIGGNPNASGTLQLTGDDVRIDFTVPAGYSIYPNNTGAFANNAIRIQWSLATSTVQISAGGSVADALGARTPITIAGATGNSNTQIVNLDIWPMVVSTLGVVSRGATATTKPTVGYQITMTARVGTADTNYTNPSDPSGPLKNYRTITYERIVIPRNW